MAVAKALAVGLKPSATSTKPAEAGSMSPRKRASQPVARGFSHRAWACERLCNRHDAHLRLSCAAPFCGAILVLKR